MDAIVCVLLFVWYVDTSNLGHATDGRRPVLTTAAITNTSFPVTSSTNTTSTTTTVSYVSGSAAVESCYLELASWASASASWESSLLSTAVLTEVYTSTVTVYSTFRLCDGMPRAVVYGNASSTLQTNSLQDTPYIVTWEEVFMPSPIILSTLFTIVTEEYLDWSGSFTSTTSIPAFPVPEPTCLIGPSDCTSLYFASSNAMFTGGGLNTTASPPLPESCFVRLVEQAYPCYIYIPLIQLI